MLQKPTVKGFVETVEQDVEMLFEIIYLNFSAVLHSRSTNGIGYWTMYYAVVLHDNRSDCRSCRTGVK